MRNFLFTLIAVLGVAGAAVTAASPSFACDPAEHNWRGECDWNGE